MMRPWVVAACCFTACVGTLAAPQQKPDPALVSTLDRTFQSKFETVDGKLFGAERATTTPEHEKARRFLPELEADKRLSGALARSGLDVAFFVAGRSAMRSERWVREKRWTRLPEDDIPAGGGRDYSEGVSDVVLLTPGVTWETAPAAHKVTMLSTAAFKAFARGEHHREHRVDGWTVIARPIPASKLACVKCHNARDKKDRVKLGDAIGIAFYAFRPAKVGKAKATATDAAPIR